MGEYLTTMDAKNAVRTLNGLFSKAHYSNTKKSIKAIRSVQKAFLTKPTGGNETRRHRRARSLRFAASILTDDLAFKKSSQKDPSRGKFNKWLKWLTWLQRQENDGTNCKQQNAVVQDITPHDLIVQTIDKALGDPKTGAISFDFTHSNAGLTVNVSWDKLTPRTYTILVTGDDAEDPDVSNGQPDADDDYEPSP